MTIRTRLQVCAAAAAVVVLASALFGVTKKEPTYIGSEMCAVCHADSHPAIVAAHAKTAHHSAMADAAKSPKAIVADLSTCPFNKSEIKYVLGTGKTEQEYLDKGFKLLPGKWNVADKKWVKVAPVDGATQCVGCHVTNFDPAKKTWTEMGVGCEACHGPGGSHADSQDPKDITNLELLSAKKLDMVCGRCHAHGTDTSGKCAFSLTFRPGMDLDQSFKLTPPTEGSPNSQYNQFITTKHAEGNVIKCATCHDTHGDKAQAAHQLRISVNDLCLGCHSVDLGATKAIAGLQAHMPTAKPDDTCATCHMKDGSHTFKAM